MARHIRATLLGKPGQARTCVGHGFCRGEGFGGHQEQGALRPQQPQHARQLVAIGVGNEVKPLARRAVGIQRQHGHVRPQVRAADADVHHVGDALVSAHAVGKSQHGVQRGVHVDQALGHAGQVTRQHLPWRTPQQGVQHRAALGGVDGLAVQHGVAVLFQPARARHV